MTSYSFGLAFAKNSKQLDCSINGPEFWCKSEVTAKRCHAVAYCKQYVWSKKTIAVCITIMKY